MTERCLSGGERVVVIAQRVAKFDVAEMFIGCLIIDTQSGNRWLWANEPMNNIDLGNIT